MAELTISINDLCIPRLNLPLKSFDDEQVIHVNKESGWGTCFRIQQIKRSGNDTLQFLRGREQQHPFINKQEPYHANHEEKVPSTSKWGLHPVQGITDDTTRRMLNRCLDKRSCPLTLP
jgi:hypothetical protein